MNALKEKLFGLVGGFGMVIYFVITAIVAYAPLLFLDLPFIVDMVIIAVVMFVPIVQNIVRPIIWICGFIAAICGTIDVFAIVYFVLTAGYALFFLLPDLATFFSFITSLFKKN